MSDIDGASAQKTGADAVDGEPLADERLVIEQVAQSDEPSHRRGQRSFDPVEARISGVIWPAIAGVSGILVYWLWYGQEDYVGRVLFLALTVTGVVCTLAIWMQLMRGSRDVD